MKNVKTYENFKKLIGGSKLVFAGAGLGATILMAGCSGCSVEPEPASEVVIETSETPSQIEVIETSEQPSEEISEEISEEPVVEAELPELPILDENGNVYTPGTFTTEEVYAAIDKMVAENEFENDLERDKAIATLIYINSPYISKETFMTIKEDYLGNMCDGDIVTLTQSYIRETRVPVNYLFLDDKQADAALQIMNYREQNKDSDEEYYDFALDYILCSSESIGYNPFNYLFYRTDNDRILIKGLKANMDIDTITSVCAGYKLVDGCVEKTFADGKSYTFEDVSSFFENYHSSHAEKSLIK